MLPDLRFVIGAVMATALLGVTLFGLAAAMHISHQSKVGPLEASRMLAYTPESGHRIFDAPARRFDDPFANIPAAVNPVPLQQQPGSAEPQAAPTLAAAAAQPAAQPESPPQPAASDADSVDERAVVDPPLPPDGDVPAEATEAAPVAAPPESSAASAPPVETQPAAPSPIAETVIEPAADVPQVGSIPAKTDATETHSETPASEAPSVTEAEEPAQAKPKRAARKAARAKKAPARRAAAQPRPGDPFASTGYRLDTTSPANRPARGFWPSID
jgi:hypothetical protein